MFQIQAEHADKALAVYLLRFISYQNLKRLDHSKFNKILNLAERPNGDVKLMHPLSPV